MAEILVTRSLATYVSVFNVNTFDFEITEDVIPTVTIEGVAFMPVKTGNAGGVDKYTMDITNILPSVIGLPNDNLPLLNSDVAALNLSKTITITVSGTGATSETITTTLLYAVSKLGESTAYIVGDKGRSEKQYHYGTVWFYNHGVEGTYTVVIGGVSADYTFYAGWNKLLLGSTHLINGTFTVLSLGMEFEVYYMGDPTGLQFVNWLNRDGCWSRCSLRKLITRSTNEKSNLIPVFNLVHTTTKTINKNISGTKTVEVSYDFIAKDATHYQLLCEIADSMLVAISIPNTTLTKLATVTNISQDIAECRQNLHFVLTLQYQDYVANY